MSRAAHPRRRKTEAVYRGVHSPVCSAEMGLSACLQQIARERNPCC